MHSLCHDAALGPIRDIHDIELLSSEEVRGISAEDFIKSLKAIRPSVSESDLKQYEGTKTNYYPREILNFHLVFFQIGIKHMVLFNRSRDNVNQIFNILIFISSFFDNMHTMSDIYYRKNFFIENSQNTLYMLIINFHSSKIRIDLSRVKNHAGSFD